MSCTNEQCENPSCKCENLEAGIICDCTENNPCPCCVSPPE